LFIHGLDASSSQGAQNLLEMNTPVNPFTSSYHQTLLFCRSFFFLVEFQLVLLAGRTNPFIAEDSDVIQEFASFVNTNLVGAFNVTAHALKHMPAGRSSVVYISSTRALQSEPHSEGYAASKAGMLGLTHAQAISLAGMASSNLWGRK
jgi:NAD(P)-dependent dehydrogenase (short-subunit alcohol dehydrogenase family)